MPQIQIGTKDLPLLIKPRINKTERTVSWIKTNQSFLYISDELTPMIFMLQYKKKGDTSPTDQLWDSTKSTDSTLYFPMPDSFYTNSVKWSIMVYWQVTKSIDPENPDPLTDEVEKIFIENALALEVKDITNV